MKALVWLGKDIRDDVVSDLANGHPRNAIIKVTSCTICGSDLPFFDNFIPAMIPGDMMGHEQRGEAIKASSESMQTSACLSDRCKIGRISVESR